jgi:hypothetical protein
MRTATPLPAQPGDDEVIVDQPPDINININEEPPRKIYVDGVGATIVAERVEYLDENGKLITESLKDFTKRALKKGFASLDDFLKRWNGAERKQVIIEELENEGLSLEPLADEVGKDLDPFDLICYLAFDQPALTRRERADNVRKRMSSRNTARRPAPCLRHCCKNTRMRASSTLATRVFCRSRRLIRWGHPCSSSSSSGHARISCSQYRTSRLLSTRRKLRPWPFAIPSNRYKTSCVRIQLSMAMPSASRSSAGCSS